MHDDGAVIILKEHPTWKPELDGMWYVLKSDFHMIALFPKFFASNRLYTYQFNVSPASQRS